MTIRWHRSPTCEKWRRSPTCEKRFHHQRGSALLAVLWLAAALSAIAFSVANTVRAETERTSTQVDALRSYYLAVGAIDRAILWVQPDACAAIQFSNRDGDH
jgi:type II secretory pathway component PulK